MTLQPFDHRRLLRLALWCVLAIVLVDFVTAQAGGGGRYSGGRGSSGGGSGGGGGGEIIIELALSDDGRITSDERNRKLSIRCRSQF